MNMEYVKVGDKFTKDGEVVEVFSIDAFKYNHIGAIFTISDVVIFGSSCKIPDAKILTKRDFLEQYKPYKPVYEYQYVLIFNNTIIRDSVHHYTDDEAKKLHSDNGKWCKFVETKRERKL